MDRGPQPAHRLPLECGRYRANSQIRGGIGRARARRYPRLWRLGGGTSPTGDPNRADCIVEVIDPVGAGFVTSLARPGGNATGFSLFEFGISGKWLELLKQISPGITKAVVIRQPSSPGGGGQLG